MLLTSHSLTHLGFGSHKSMLGSPQQCRYKTMTETHNRMESSEQEIGNTCRSHSMSLQKSNGILLNLAVALSSKEINKL